MRTRKYGKVGMLILVFASVIATGVPCVASGHGSASERTEKIYFYATFGWGTEADAQYNMLFDEVTRLLKEEMKIDVEYKHFTNEADFYKALTKPGPKFAVIGKRDQLVRAITEYGYEPYVAYEVFGLKNNRICLYVDKTGGIDRVEQLAGKRIGIYDEKFAYYTLWDMVGRRPDEFFGKLERSSGNLGSIYLLSMGEIESVLATDQVYAFLKSNNPGMAAKMKKLTCGEPYVFMPTLKTKDMPVKAQEKLLELFRDVSKGKKLKQYSSLFRMSAIKFRKVTESEYQADIEMSRKAAATGRDKAYIEWREAAGAKDKQAK